ncbi:MAG: hypothetical protein J6T34_01380 [Bacilli bacterium]|nr:hypothetical protein [Bacilli bacterium]
MTVSLFISLLAGFATVSSLVTEVEKKIFANFGKTPSPNLLALIDALIIGGGGTSVAYLLLEIPFSPINIVAIVGMFVAVGISSMVGYDKVIQLIQQLTELKSLAKEESNEEKVED